MKLSEASFQGNAHAECGSNQVLILFGCQNVILDCPYTQHDEQESWTLESRMELVRLELSLVVRM